MNTPLSLFILFVTLSYLFFWWVLKKMNGRKIELERQVLEKSELLMHAQANERKATEQVISVNRSKKQLLIRINHDIRTPLNGILGTVSLLDNTTLNAEQKEYNDTIRNCSESLLTSVNDIYQGEELTLAHVESDKVRLPDESFQQEGEGRSDFPVQKLSGDFAKKYPLKILIAEDNRVNQKIAVRMISKLGYDPDIAVDGKEVLEEVSKVNYDLILMDVQMPEMDGLEATRMVRLCLPVQPVIIAMTANAMQGDREECIQAGMDDYISKPVHLEELVVKLEKWAQHVNEKKSIKL
jgi:CheY-like chemotaxis protein